MIKVIGLLKRRQGMSVEAFREHYESTHRRIGEKYLNGFASRYARHFLNPTSEAASAPFGAEGDFDVIMEICYPDQARFEAAQKRLRAADAAKEILEDELKLFDRPRNRFFTVTESVSTLRDPD